jgi:hypothetical protein
MADPRIWIDPPVFSWSRVLRIGGLWLAVVLALLLPFARKADDPVTQTPTLARLAPAAAMAQRAKMQPTAEQRAASSAAPASGEILACGGIRLKAQAGAEPDTTLLLSRLDTPATREARERTVAALRASKAELAQAAALILDADVTATATAFASQASVPQRCEGEGCAPDEPGKAVATTRFDALARLAVTTSDPRLYGVAFQACGPARGRIGGACQMLSADQWARLDSENAAPWLVMAASAQQTQNPAALAEAMHHVAKAKRSDVGWGVLPEVVLSHAPDGDVASLATTQLLIELIGVQAAWANPGYQAASAYCRDEALRDANRRQTCAEVADVLTHRSATLLDQMTGAAIGARVGWAPERIEALKTEREAIQQVMANRLGTGRDALSCERVRAHLSYVRDVARLGEVGAGRLAIQRSGTGMAEWARLFREAAAKSAQADRLSQTSGR